VIEVLISRDDINLSMETARSELSDILMRTHDTVTKDAVRLEEKKLLRDSVEMLVANHYAISTKLKDRGVLYKEKNSGPVVWNYSLSCAATAALNYIELKLSRPIDFGAQSMSPVDPGKLQGGSRYSVLANTLSNLRSYVQSSRGGHSAYTLAYFMAALEKTAASVARFKCSDEGFEHTLRQIKLVSDTDLVSYQARKRETRNEPVRSENGQKVLEGDTLPDSLPLYQRTNVLPEQVVGNVEAMSELLDYTVMTLHYDPKTRKNHWWAAGNGMPEGAVLYGQPGVGKTFMASSIMNYAIMLARQKKLEFSPVEINASQINSVYQNRAATVLEHYLKMLRRGDSSYMVLMDEFNDLVPMGSDAKMNSDAVQRLNAFKRNTGNHGALGNYFMIAITNRISKDDIPPEIQNRLVPIYVPGPQTAAEYGQILKLGLSHRLEYINGVNWERVGSHLMGWNRRLQQSGNPDAHIGRGYKMVTQALSRNMKTGPRHYAAQTLGQSPEFHASFYAPKMLRIDEKAVMRTIDNSMENMLRSRNYRGPQ